MLAWLTSHIRDSWTRRVSAICATADSDQRSASVGNGPSTANCCLLPTLNGQSALVSERRLQCNELSLYGWPRDRRSRPERARGFPARLLLRRAQRGLGMPKPVAGFSPSRKRADPRGPPVYLMSRGSDFDIQEAALVEHAVEVIFIEVGFDRLPADELSVDQHPARNVFNGDGFNVQCHVDLAGGRVFAF